VERLAYDTEQSLSGEGFPRTVARPSVSHVDAIVVVVFPATNTIGVVGCRLRKALANSRPSMRTSAVPFRHPQIGKHKGRRYPTASITVTPQLCGLKL
jgi:hypothetical protein